MSDDFDFRRALGRLKGQRRAEESPAEERFDFGRALGPVRRLAAPPVPPRPQRKIRNDRLIEAQSYRAEVGAFEPLNLENMDEGRFRRLRANQLPVAREIDLHGFLVDEAQRYLQDLIDERQNRRAEIWTVIHGKGRETTAPLKLAIWALLQRHPAITALAPVIDARGEVGAVNVEVRPIRRRPK